MPLGLLLMVGVSVVFFRRARAVGRSGFLWVLLLWIIAIGVGLLGGIASGILFLLDTAPTEMSDYEIKEAIKFPTAIGMIIGAVITLWLAGRPVAKAPEVDDLPETGDG